MRVQSCWAVDSFLYALNIGYCDLDAIYEFMRNCQISGTLSEDMLSLSNGVA